MLPSDSHVHSQWSWDALGGSMEQTCVRAVELGLPSLAFTEHADFTPWIMQDGDSEHIPTQWQPLVTGDVLTPPELDLNGYLQCLQRCRERFPTLHIGSGIELSEPHWHADRASQLLALGDFDRVLASVHSVAVDDGLTEVSGAYRHRPPAEVVREYLAETIRMIEQFDAFEVLAHIDYPVRHWPTDAAPYELHVFEGDYRNVLRALATAGKALEVNTTVPLHPQIVRWWHQEGGEAITFGSDAHDPAALAGGFADAAAMAEAGGFRPGGHPHDFWRRG
ncbi:PHP domain-containing protein [Streptomyces agglomeratus]|uniref:PHP domain-containing protein n=1 Tax=Streptomyces agglomeratus TaxID=285458 RepID=UPI001C408842|nr:PHP domain-containing protein [Streptomyces agglomeratus]